MFIRSARGLSARCSGRGGAARLPGLALHVDVGPTIGSAPRSGYMLGDDRDDRRLRVPRGGAQR